jgi:hypothetical protein
MMRQGKKLFPIMTTVTALCSAKTILLRQNSWYMKLWKKLSHAEQDRRITEALALNIDYKTKVSLGVPASRLDSNVFYEQAPFLKDAPLLRTYVANPNRI